MRLKATDCVDLGAFLERLVTALWADGQATRIVGTRIESRYFCSLLWLTVVSDGVRHRMVVKFPKAEMRRGFRCVPARERADVAMGRHEYDALQTLGRAWRGQVSEYVSPLWFDSDTGAIVLPYVAGSQLYRRFLNLTGHEPEAASLLQVMGGDLAQYHQGERNTRALDVTAMVGKIEELAGRVSTMSRTAVAEDVRREVARLVGEIRGTAPCVPTIKGFEIRNVIVAPANQLYLHDPGRFKQEAPEADVARFIISCRMLNWGTWRFPLRQGSRGAEDSFLRGYCHERNVDVALLGIYVIRELLKNWVAGIKAARSKPVPTTVSDWLVRRYVNRGFSRILTRSLWDRWGGDREIDEMLGHCGRASDA